MSKSTRRVAPDFVTEGRAFGMMAKKGAVVVNVTLNLNPEVEKDLMARAQARGISVDDYIQELVAKEAGPVAGGVDLRPIDQRFANLSDLLLNSPFAGSDLNLDRSKDYPRAVGLG